MHNKFKLSLITVALSLALTGCKSTSGAHVEAKNNVSQAVEITKESASDEEKDQPEDNKKEEEEEKQLLKPQDETVVKPKEDEKKSVEPTQPSVPETTQETTKAINEDNAGKLWRVIPLTENGSLIDFSEQRRSESEHFTEKDESVFESDEDSYNGSLVLDLGTNDKNNSNIVSIKSSDKYLGTHSGKYQNSDLENPADIHYLYVNQPYSSYGSLFTDATDSRLFHIQLSTGRNGGKQLERGRGSSYAEYGVFDIVDGKAKWNENLIGDATYTGKVIARVEQKKDNVTTVSEPKFDGNVIMTLHLDNDWDKNKLNGYVNSQTLGKIELQDATLPNNSAALSRDFISFNSNAKVVNNTDLEGVYYTQFAGENLNDVVGRIELENEKEIKSGVIKYNAVFGGTKQK